MKETARIDVPSRDCRLAMRDKTLYVGIAQTITVVDLSLPSSPQTLSRYELPVSSGLSKDPPMPDRPGLIEWERWATINDLWVDGHYLYVSFGAGGLRVVDVSDPKALREVARVDVGGFAISMTRNVDRLYLTKSDRQIRKLQLCVLDVTDPNSPRVLSSTATESDFVLGGVSFAYCWMRPQVVGNHVFVGGLKGMEVITLP